MLLKRGGVPLDKDNIKWLFNMMLYGGGPDTWRDKLAEVKENMDTGYCGTHRPLTAPRT
jgi:hypothetical protein